MFNNTTASAPEFYPQVLKITLYTFYSFIFFIGVSGNILVIYIIGIKHKLERSCDVHIVLLAIADLLTAIFTPIVRIDYMLTNGEWHLLGEFGCKFFRSMYPLVTVVSSLMLVTISLTRMNVIYSSTTIPRRMRRSIVEVTVVWVLSVTIILPYTYHLTVIKETFCFDLWDPKVRFLYFTIFLTVSFFLPVIIMVIVYSLSALRLFRHSAIPGDNKVGEKRRIKQNQRVTRMFGSIVLLFFCLTTPYNIFYLIHLYYFTYEYEVSGELQKTFLYTNELFFLLAAFNCCVNPFIYAKMHCKMKRTIWPKKKKGKLSPSQTLQPNPQLNQQETPYIV